MKGDPDVVVIGSGPNGLTAACTLAKRGHRVLVLEANPRRPGGALGSEEWTRPGFVHDVGAGFFPFARSSPAFRALDLEAAGVVWQNAELETCHPALDGTHACIARDPELTAHHFGSERDGLAWRRLAAFHRGIEPRLLEALMEPFPAFAPALRLGLGNLLRIAWMFAAQLLWAATFVLLWTRWADTARLSCAVGYGFLMGLFSGVWAIVNYVVLPMPCEIAAKWFFAGIVQSILLGLVTFYVYKPKPQPVTM